LKKPETTRKWGEKVIVIEETCESRKDKIWRLKMARDGFVRVITETVSRQ